MQPSGLPVVITASVTRCFVAFLVVATLLPLLPVGAWIVRLFDFPRVQFVAMLAVPVVGIVCWSRSSGWLTEHTILSLACFVVLSWQLSHIAKYTPLWPLELSDSQLDVEDRNGRSLTSTVINLEYKNSEKAAVRDQITKQRTDLLLLIELDDPWQEALWPLEADYPYREGVVRGEGLGIMLWSKPPFRSAKVRHRVTDDRASIFAEFQTTDGQTINFVGLYHLPLPPSPSDFESAKARWCALAKS